MKTRGTYLSCRIVGARRRYLPAQLRRQLQSRLPGVDFPGLSNRDLGHPAEARSREHDSKPQVQLAFQYASDDQTKNRLSGWTRASSAQEDTHVCIRSFSKRRNPIVARRNQDSPKSYPLRCSGINSRSVPGAREGENLIAHLASQGQQRHVSPEPQIPHRLLSLSISTWIHVQLQV